MGPVRVGSLVRLLCPEVVAGWSDASYSNGRGIDLEFEGVHRGFGSVPYGSFGIVTEVRSERESLHEFSVRCYWSARGRQSVSSPWVLGCEYEVVVF